MSLHAAAGLQGAVPRVPGAGSDEKSINWGTIRRLL
ncbi:MAG: hypothetical protein RL376_688, partial [Verrucomicrobiota bacterium]